MLSRTWNLLGVRLGYPSAPNLLECDGGWLRAGGYYRLGAGEMPILLDKSDLDSYVRRTRCDANLMQNTENIPLDSMVLQTYTYVSESYIGN
jgi:hypothetical protein